MIPTSAKRQKRGAHREHPDNCAVCCVFLSSSFLAFVSAVVLGLGTRDRLATMIHTLDTYLALLF